MSYFAGVDIGASATKVAVVDQAGSLKGSSVRRSGVDFAASAEAGFDEALTQAGLTRKDVAKVISCGYGRKNVAFADETRTEIACHAAGAYFHYPQALTVVDIGGQDNKVIKLDRAGRRTSFKMNRKCAAGTGAFLEEMALRLDIDLSKLNDLASTAETETTLGAFCTVFTGTELLSKIRDGVKVQSLVKGLYRSVVKRVREMDTFTDLIVMTGGVVEHHPYLIEMMADEVGREVVTTPHPQLNGAWGAALIARKLNE